MRGMRVVSQLEGSCEWLYARCAIGGDPKRSKGNDERLRVAGGERSRSYRRMVSSPSRGSLAAERVHRAQGGDGGIKSAGRATWATGWWRIEARRRGRLGWPAAYGSFCGTTAPV